MSFTSRPRVRRNGEMAPTPEKVETKLRSWVRRSRGKVPRLGARDLAWSYHVVSRRINRVRGWGIVRLSQLRGETAGPRPQGGVRCCFGKTFACVKLVAPDAGRIWPPWSNSRGGN